MARGLWLRTQTVDPGPAWTSNIQGGDADAIARGRHLALAVLACNECHGDDLAGEVILDAPLFARVVGPNLTPAGPLAGYTAADWERAVRHGIDRGGRPLVLMPSDAWASLSSSDLAALIAYLDTLEPIARELPDTRMGPFGLLAIGAGRFPLTARDIDHAAVGVDAPEPAPTAAYGRYIAEVSGCRSCHGADFDGRSFGPGQPSAPPITPEALEGWSADELARAVREGIGRDGRQLDPLMPVASFAGMTDLEMKALSAFLQMPSSSP